MKSILRWMPAVILLALFGSLWKSAASGGDQGVISWLLLMGGLPYLGGIVLTGLVAAYAWKRKLTAPLITTFFVSLVVIWPGL